ncbi:hypothetical protein PMAYCL1PPCAC_16695, partial [Pristionchus mayeri]
SALGDIDWSAQGTRRPYLGSFCALFGAIAIPPYLACAAAMVSMKELSAYKIMIYLAAADISDLLFASIGYGIMAITGEVYCAHPRFQLLFSMGLEFFFFCATTACFLLALNRFGEMLFIESITRIFKGSRTVLMLLVCTIPIFLLVLFTPPMLFNSTHHMLFFDPMIFEGRFVYDSYVHFACVTFMPTASLLLYLLMLAGIVHKHGSLSKWSESNALSNAKFQIFVQSGIIISIHLTSMMTFQVLQLLPARAVDSALYFAHFGWMMVHGTPSLVYLTLNPTIRE